MSKLFRDMNRRRERGQGMTEYIIIVVFIAVLSLVVVNIFGDNIRALFGSAANSLAGQGETSVEALGAKPVDATMVNRKINNLGEEP